MTNYPNVCKEVSLLDHFPASAPVLNGSGFHGLLTKIAIWNERSKQRGRLTELDSRLLEDIGLTVEQADLESSKPFWVK